MSAADLHNDGLRSGNTIATAIRANSVLVAAAGGSGSSTYLVSPQVCMVGTWLCILTEFPAQCIGRHSGNPIIQLPALLPKYGAWWVHAGVLTKLTHRALKQHSLALSTCGPDVVGAVPVPVTLVGTVRAAGGLDRAQSAACT
jgi:hypothetical protein